MFVLGGGSSDQHQITYAVTPIADCDYTAVMETVSTAYGQVTKANPGQEVLDLGFQCVNVEMQRAANG